MVSQPFYDDIFSVYTSLYITTRSNYNYFNFKVCLSLQIGFLVLTTAFPNYFLNTASHIIRKIKCYTLAIDTTSLIQFLFIFRYVILDSKQHPPDIILPSILFYQQRRRRRLHQSRSRQCDLFITYFASNTLLHIKRCKLCFLLHLENWRYFNMSSSTI